MTVPSHCVRAMRAAASLLASLRPSLQSASLRLMSACITLLRDCVHPTLLWKVSVEGEPYEEEEEAAGKELLVTEVKTGILVVGRSLYNLYVLITVNSCFDKQNRDVDVIPDILYDRRIHTFHILLQGEMFAVSNNFLLC